MRSVILLCALMTASVAFAEPAVLAANETKLEVEALGIATRPASIATLGASIKTTGPTSAKAVTANAEIAGRLEAAVSKSALVAKIRSQEFALERVEADRDRETTGPKPPVTYAATKSYQFELSDVRRVGALIDLLSSFGITEITSPDFSIENPDELVRLARADAFEKARSQAEDYAKATGFRIVRTLRLSERNRYSNDAAEMAYPAAAYLAQSTNIAPADVSEHVTLWADFALAPK